MRHENVLRFAITPRAFFISRLQPVLHYQVEQISKPEILRELKQRFGAKVNRDICFRVGSSARLGAPTMCHLVGSATIAPPSGRQTALT